MIRSNHSPTFKLQTVVLRSGSSAVLAAEPMITTHRSACPSCPQPEHLKGKKQCLHYPKPRIFLTCEAPTYHTFHQISKDPQITAPQARDVRADFVISVTCLDLSLLDAMAILCILLGKIRQAPYAPKPKSSLRVAVHVFLFLLFLLFVPSMKNGRNHSLAIASPALPARKMTAINQTTNSNSQGRRSIKKVRSASKQIQLQQNNLLELDSS